MSMPQVVGAAAKPPSQEAMGQEVDIEMSPPPQRVMQSAAAHCAGPEQYTQESDQLYSKCICYKCGIGEVLGNTVVGQNCKCFCISNECICGLGGPSGCPKANEVCEMYPPTADCGAQMKCFCCKYGVVAPWVEGKPWLICCKKQIA